MPQLTWTPEALRGIQRIHSFLAPKSPVAASRAVRAVREGLRTIATHPGAGRAAEKMAPEFREWLIPFGDSGYVALYRVQGDMVVILAIRHQREAGYS
jgi:plasmid stabilization system protein ParE